MKLTLQEKFKIYFKENGIRQDWLSEKIGMPKPMFYQWMIGKRAMPYSYWRDIVMWTRGKISFADLLDYKLGYPDDLEMRDYVGASKCSIGFKDFEFPKE